LLGLTPNGLKARAFSLLGVSPTRGQVDSSWPPT